MCRFTRQRHSTPRIGYVAKSGPIKLIFGAMNTEFQGEADYYVKLAPERDFMLSVRLMVFGPKTKTAGYVAK